MSYMFEKFKTSILDITHFKTDKLKYKSDMFNESSIAKLYENMTK